MNSGLQRFQRQGLLIGSLALLMGLGTGGKAVHAEGSIDLITDTVGGGYRPFLEYRNDKTGTIPRLSLIKVYAQAGETINLGSSATGLGGGTINFTRPDGSTGTCGVGVGLIPNLNAEVNRTYTPCTVTVGAGQTGIWTIDFVSPDPTNQSNPTATLVGAAWTQPNSVGYVAAWDVTVTNNGQAIPGRAYANYLALNMGANDNGLALNSTTFIQTDIGYQYQVNLNGIDPFGFIFFANSKGFRDAAGNQLFQSVPIAGSNVYSPAQQDDPGNKDITYKIFFNKPDPNLPTSAPIAPRPGVNTDNVTWLVTPPQPITNVSDFKFVGKEGTPGRAGSKPAPPPPELGGNFTFNAGGPGNYVITIDANRDGILGNGNDVILRGTTTGGLVTVPWNGLDSRGRPLLAGATPYDSKLTFFVGDVHFPFLDPENNPRGLKIRNITTGSRVVYYNDSDVRANNQIINPSLNNTPPKPISALDGIDSIRGVHSFGDNFGNDNGIDTWTSLVNPIVLSGGILIQKADPAITKTVGTNSVAAGGPITYTLTVTSNPPPRGDTYTSIKGVPVTDIIPSEITGVSWTCAPTSGVAACSVASGTGNNINLTVDLNVGATVTITVQGTVSPLASGALVNTATVDRPPDVVDDNLNNNTSSIPVTVLPNPIQPAGIKSVRLFTDVDNSGTLTTGDIVEYTVIYSNTRPDIDVLGFQVTDVLDTTKLSFVSGSYSFTASGAGTTVTSNPNYNGTTDQNLVTPGGTLGRAGGQVVMKFRAVVTASAGIVIINQAIAQSTNGTINPSISDAFAGLGDIPQVTDDGVNQGNFPNTGDDEPTLLVVTAPGVGPHLRVVKRMTNVTRNGVPVSGINFGSFVDDTTTDNDNAPGWSAVLGGLPVGALNIGDGIALSGDDIEYTIYFLSDGSQAVQNAQLCDAIPAGSTFINNSFGAASGLLLNQTGTSNPQTNAQDTDKGSFFSPLTPVASPCADTNNPNGSVLFQLGDIPPNNGGFVRFRVRIN